MEWNLSNWWPREEEAFVASWRLAGLKVFGPHLGGGETPALPPTAARALNSFRVYSGGGETVGLANSVCTRAMDGPGPVAEQVDGS